MLNFSLDGKVAVITGGASGIGQAIVELFAEQGASVHVIDLDSDGLEATAGIAMKKGGQVTSHKCDVAVQEEVIGVFEGISLEQRINILINNAGIAHVGTIEDTTEADLDRILRVNVKGAYNCIYACIGHMKAKGGGVILNMASAAASAGVADRFAYSVSKGALLTMTYSVAQDYVAHNIRCNSISPARVHTPFVDGYLKKNYPGREVEMFKNLARTQPIGRMAEPREVAALALFLCSDEAAFMTGTDYPIDGGFLRLRS
jgi:NAD(P)-dependent dehydrogenase (short-subunit alcohol dehydrogenase family)